MNNDKCLMKEFYRFYKISMCYGDLINAVKTLKMSLSAKMKYKRRSAATSIIIH